MSTLSVNTIQPYSGSTVTITGFSVTGSAVTGSVTSASYAISASNAVNALTAGTANSASTASYATFAVTATSASYAQTASYATNFTASNILITGLATVASASIEYLTVVYQSSSVVYSSGSNTFGDASNDTQTLWGTINVVTGPTRLTGSLAGNVGSLSITSNTASVDLATGNFFTLTLPTGSTYINPSNIASGQTVNLIITTASGSSVSFPSTVKQVSGSAYTPTQATSTDVLTFIAPNTSSLLLANVKNFV